MTKNDIIKMARKAGLAKHGLGWTCWEGQLERFAELIEAYKTEVALVEAYEAGAAAEREACAQVCDEMAASDALTPIEKYRALFIADAIRARGRHD